MIIGSTAVKHWFPDFPREPKDLDTMLVPGIYDNTDNFWHPTLRGTILDRPGYANPDELYTIKLSHSYWDLKNGTWAKHIYDLQWLKGKGAWVIQPIHDLLYSVWEEKHGKKKMKFSESTEFFDDAVDRVYDHDSIHASVAYYDEPLYIRTLLPGYTVKVDMNRVWEMSFTDQVKLFREEVYATALERIMIPKNYHFSPGAAYLWALRRTITSLTRGRSAQFLVENYRLFAQPDCDYVARHLRNKERLIKL